MIEIISDIAIMGLPYLQVQKKDTLGIGVYHIFCRFKKRTLRGLGCIIFRVNEPPLINIMQENQ